MQYCVSCHQCHAKNDPNAVVAYAPARIHMYGGLCAINTGLHDAEASRLILGCMGVREVLIANQTMDTNLKTEVLPWLDKKIEFMVSRICRKHTVCEHVKHDNTHATRHRQPESNVRKTVKYTVRQ